MNSIYSLFYIADFTDPFSVESRNPSRMARNKTELLTLNWYRVTLGCPMISMGTEK